MKKNKVFYWLFLLLGLLPLLANAQTSAQAQIAGEPELCLGTQYAYKLYPRDVMVGIQNSLWAMYHGDPAWQSDTQMTGSPLSDGLMGPVTWSWMNRFCTDYSLQLGKDPVAELPEQTARIAAFADKHRNEHDVLISYEFSVWHKAAADVKKISAILYKGSDDDLLALVRRYLQRDTLPDLPVSETKAANTLYIYSLRAEDFAKLQQPNLLPAAIKSLVDKPFATDAEADAAIAKALEAAPKDQKTKFATAIHQQMSAQISYQFNEANLSALASSGLSASQIAELNKLPKESVTNEEKFKKMVTAALTNVPPKTQASAQETLPGATPAAASEPAPVAASDTDADITLAQIRVLNATKTSQLKLSADAAEKIIDSFFHKDDVLSLDPLVVKALEGLRDIEYPDGDLLHHAALDKLVKELSVCEENKSNSIDIKLAPLKTDERAQLRKQFTTKDISEDTRALLGEIQDPLLHEACDESFLRDMQVVYNQTIRPAIEKVYRKEAPAYTGADINWTGKECGCIPKEITATAYGIYPYWHQSDKPQNFDFSTFSRVGYYGLSFNGSGQLTQPNTQNQSQTLLNINSKISHNFMAEARTYGSKVDWIIEKDWNEEKSGQSEVDPIHLREALKGLHNNILELLKSPMEDTTAKLRPWISLGIAQAPTLGDGVTLYFKHYPQTPEAKTAFEIFFRDLKRSLQKLSDDNARWHAVSEVFFVNLIISQEDYQNPQSLFNSTNLFTLIDVPYEKLAKLTVLEEQQLTRTLVLVLLKDPYYNAMSELYATSTATNRGYVLPAVFMDYKNFSTGVKEVGEDKRAFYDERRKNVSFQREAFGGGGYWAMPTWDAKDSGEFNNYVASHFALGYPTSVWDSKLCAYRWAIIGVMNLWLLSALIFVLVIFYIFPYRCHNLPGFIEWLLNPVVLAIIILPPIAIWIYLMVADSSFPILSVPGALNIALILLSTWAGVTWVRELRQRKPTRNLAYAQATRATPVRQKPEAPDDDNDFLD